MGPGASKAREYSLARQGFVRVELVRIAPRDEVLAGRYQGVVGGIATSTTPCHARGRRRGACRCLLPSPSWHPSRCLLPSRPLPGPGVLPSPSWHPDALRTMTRPHEANTTNTSGRRRGACRCLLPSPRHHRSHQPLSHRSQYRSPARSQAGSRWVAAAEHRMGAQPWEYSPVEPHFPVPLPPQPSSLVPQLGPPFPVPAIITAYKRRWPRQLAMLVNPNPRPPSGPE